MIKQRVIDIITFAYLAVVVAVAIVSLSMGGAEAPSVLPNAEVTDAADKALDVTLELTKQVVTLATALIGACLWLLTRPLGAARELLERLIFTIAALLAFAASLYFGFQVFDGSLTYLSWNVFDPRADMVWLPQTLQYYCFVGGAALLGLACLRSINAIIERSGG
jgi:hypothetical protein